MLCSFRKPFEGRNPLLQLQNLLDLYLCRSRPDERPEELPGYGGIGPVHAPRYHGFGKLSEPKTLSENRQVEQDVGAG